jgi:transposase
METTIDHCCECDKLRAELAILKHDYDWLKRQLFGQKSERYIPNDQQMTLDLDIAPSEVTTKTQKITYERTTTKKKKGHSRETMPTHLPFEDVHIYPDEDIEGLKELNVEISWEYLYEPGSLKIRRFLRHKYIRSEHDGVIIGSLPARPIEKGNFGPEFMSTVTIDKYVYHLPLWRQIKKFNDEYKVVFSESTFCDLVAKTAFWLEPVYEIFKEDIIHSDYLQVDETTIPVLVKRKKGKAHKGYYWVYYDPLHKIVLFEYCYSRKKEHPFEFLRKFKGVLQVDGYAGYNHILDRSDIVRAACMDHVRRKFEKALSYNKQVAQHALETMKVWYEHEACAREEQYSFDQRLAMRQKHIEQSMATFKEWCFEQVKGQRPESPIRKACEYALGQWDGFDPYLSDGRVEISNIRVENLIRPVAIGRKNYMFKGSEAAAQRGAVIYSIVATARMHGKNPREYVKELLEKLPNAKAHQIRNFLPY